MAKATKPKDAGDDSILVEKVAHLTASVRKWLRDEGLLCSESFRTWEEYYGPFARPWKDPVVLLLGLDGPFARELAGERESRRDVAKQFLQFVDNSEFWFDFQNSDLLAFHARDDRLAAKYYEKELFFWRCRAVIPEYADLDAELYDHIKKKPSRLRDLSSRTFEEFVCAVFKNHGYRTHLGPGTGDAGVDIHLYQHDRIGELVTLVQLKRFAEHRPIGLEAVSALKAAVDDQRANRGLFITTSRYLPSAKKFADRYSHQLTLADSSNVADWCSQVSARMTANSSAQKPLLDEQVFAGIWEASRGNYPAFAAVIKETATTLFYYELENDHTACGVVPRARNGSLVHSCHFKVARKEIDTDGTVYFSHDVYGFRYKRWNGDPMTQCTWD